MSLLVVILRQNNSGHAFVRYFRHNRLPRTDKKAPFVSNKRDDQNEQKANLEKFPYIKLFSTIPRHGFVITRSRCRLH